jgi:hypothetical protein
MKILPVDDDDEFILKCSVPCLLLADSGLSRLDNV